MYRRVFLFAILLSPWVMGESERSAETMDDPTVLMAEPSEAAPPPPESFPSAEVVPSDLLPLPDEKVASEVPPPSPVTGEVPPPSPVTGEVPPPSPVTGEVPPPSPVTEEIGGDQAPEPEEAASVPAIQVHNEQTFTWGEKLPRVEDYGAFTSPLGTAVPADSQVILMCEQHDSLQHVGANQEFMDKYAKDGDIVLTEGVDAGLEIPAAESPFTKLLKAKVTVRGWDNLLLRDDAAVKMRGLLQLRSKIIEAQSKGEPATVLEDTLKNLKKEIDPIAQTQRNESLLKVAAAAIQEGLEKNKRVFIVGGCRHFTEDPKVEAFFKDRKYILLMPKGEPTGMDAIVDYFEQNDAPTAPRNIAEQIQKKPDPIIRKALVRVILPDGTLLPMGRAWFTGEKEILPGEEVEMNPEMGTSYDREQLAAKGFVPGKKFKVK